MLTDAKTYCYNKVAQPSEALYYSLRKLSPNQRDLVVAIHTFYQEIEEVVFECNDHELGLKKLNWWRGEVLSLGKEEAHHPVMIMLKNAAVKPELIQEKLLTIIDAFEPNLMPAPFDSFEDVVVHFMRTAGQREELIYALLKKDETISTEIIYQLMLVVELVNYIQHLRAYVRRDIIYFPIDELMQFHVSNEMLREFKTTMEIKNLLQHQSEKINRAYFEGVKKLSRGDRSVLSHLLIRCEIAIAVWQEIKAIDYTVLENLIKLTPLRYGWLALRA